MAGKQFAPVDLGGDSVLYFMHIPKTAGTTLSFYLDTQFSEDEILPFKRWDKWWSSDSYDNNEDHPFSGYKLVRGHFGYGVWRQIGQKPHYITMLRDPVERSISGFGHIQKSYERNKNFSHHIVIKGESFDDVLKDDEKAQFFGSVQAIQLASDFDFVNAAKSQWGDELVSKMPGDIDVDEFKFTDQDKLASEAIDKVSSFSFVGIQEYFQESLLLLAATFGFAPGKDNKKLMVYKNRPKADSLSSESIAKLKEVNAADVGLFDNQKADFEQVYLNLVESKLSQKMSWNEYMENRDAMVRDMFSTLEKEFSNKLKKMGIIERTKFRKQLEKNLHRVNSEINRRKQLQG